MIWFSRDALMLTPVTSFYRRWRSTLFALILWTYGLWPARESSLLTGAPLSVLGFGACLLIALALFTRAAPTRRWMVPAALALAALKIAAMAFVLPSGWAARYYTNDQFQGPHEPAIDFRDPRWTRLETGLQFEGATFPFHFFNELRYNFQPDRRVPPLSAHYTGYITVDTPRTLHVGVSTTNGVDVIVAGQTAITRPAAERGHVQRSATVPLPAGVHQIVVRYVAQSSTPRKLGVSLRVGDATAAADRGLAPPVRPVATTASQEARSWWLRWVVALLDLIALALIAVWSAEAFRAWWRTSRSDIADTVPNIGTMLMVTAFAVWGVILYAGWSRVPSAYNSILTGLDANAYEEYARKFAMGDWLLDKNTAGLGGRVLFYTVGYHLMMSAAHLLFGESLWRVYFFQDWLLWGSVALIGASAMRIGGWSVGVIAFVLAAYVKAALFWPIHNIYRENLVVVMNAALVFLFTSRRPFSPARAAGTGAVAGFNGLTDPINLFAVPVMLWLVHRLSAPETRRRTVQMFAIGWVLLVAIVPARNLIVAGSPAPIPTEGPPTLHYGNRPPPDVYPDPPPHESFLTAVATYAWDEPRHFTTNLVNKAAYSFGFYTALSWPWAIYLQFVVAVFAIWVLAILGTWPSFRQHLGTVLIVLLSLARWASIVVFIALDRYVVALSMLLVPLAAVGLRSMWHWQPLAAMLVVAAIGGDHYLKGNMDMGIVARWPGGRLLGSKSYHALRREQQASLPPGTRWRWTFPADTAAFRLGPSVGVIDDDTPTFQMLRSEEGLISTPSVQIPAELIEAIEIEAGFTGTLQYARIYLHRHGQAAISYFMRVDYTGTVKTYRVPVWQSREWNGLLDRIEIGYDGDTVVAKRVEIVPYSDVIIGRQPAAPTQTH